MIVQSQMQVRSGRVASAADIPQKLALPDRCAGTNRQPGQMAIDRLPALRMVYYHAVAKGPHTTYTIRRRPTVLGIAHGSSPYRIDRLSIAVCKGDINAIVPRVGVPGVSGERESKAALGYSAGPAQRVCRQRIISENMVYIVNISIPAPPMDSRLPDRKFPGIFFGVAAPCQRPGYVAVSKVVALQGQAYMWYITWTRGACKP